MARKGVELGTQSLSKTSPAAVVGAPEPGELADGQAQHVDENGNASTVEILGHDGEHLGAVEDRRGDPKLRGLMAAEAPAPPPVTKYLVTDGGDAKRTAWSFICPYSGTTKIEVGRVVDERSQDVAAMRKQGIALKPVEE